MACLMLGEPLVTLPNTTMMGAMAHYITHASPDNFQPMNANFGIVSPIEGRFKGKTGKKDKNNAIADRALEHLKLFEESVTSLTSG